MPQHADTTRSRKRAVIYLRVSTPRQMQTDFDPLGISIPAQEEAARRKAAELDAEVVKVFIEPGRTATTIDKRPVFQEMLAFVKADKHIDYVIVYMFSRAFRNAVDAGVTKQDLRKLGTRLVATNLDLGEGPESDMIETILHAVDQYRSEADGADIAYKMGKKAQAGGTISAAKYGYRNVRVEVDGRKVATVHVEPTEAAYVKQAFELYATGKYSQRLLLDTLTDLGMRSRGNTRFGSRPLSVHKIGQILQDRYYLGYVTYKGVEYKGRHEAIIPPELFERVQRVLYSERGAGARQRVHNHYLKGVLWCHRCQRRLIVMPGKSKSGVVYFYYMCRGRQLRQCDLPYFRVEHIEKAVEQHYATVRIAPDIREAIRERMSEAVTERRASQHAVTEQLTARLRTLDEQENRYLDLVHDPAWPTDKLAARLQEITTERSRITRQLAHAEHELDAGQALVEQALRLLDRPQELYARSTKRVRKLLNKAIFTKLYIDDGTAGPRAIGEKLAEPFETLVYFRQVATGQETTRQLPQTLSDVLRQQNGALPEEDATDMTVTDLFAPAFAGQCSSRAVMVEGRDLEDGGTECRDES